MGVSVLDKKLAQGMNAIITEEKILHLAEQMPLNGIKTNLIIIWTQHSSSLMNTSIHMLSASLWCKSAADVLGAGYRENIPASATYGATQVDIRE